jgi:Asp-tRNA(Asn)/Glu-tRNA(Gln) amidotransferase A subunit family amidase
MNASGRYERRVVSALARCEREDFDLRAWVVLDPVGAIAQARALDAASQGRPMAGSILGIKDVIDLAGLPTRAGSWTRNAAPPATADAIAVKRLRDAGAIPLGKTVTTEFATMDPGPTANPYDISRTPGGSSSGSAAAVGAGMVDLALGTQTAGSLCRPAAYCGIAAFKPSLGRVPTEGMVPLAPSFDTIGVMARRVADLASAACALVDGIDLSKSGPLRIAVPGEAWNRASAACARAAVETAIGALRTQGDTVVPFDPPANLDEILTDHRSVMAAEAFAAHGAVLDLPLDRVGPRFRELLSFGATLDVETVHKARERLERARRAVWATLETFDAVLLEPVPDIAPERASGTGPAERLIPWTVFGGPLVVVPVDLDPRTRMPVAVMLAGAPGRDGTILERAIRLAEVIDRIPACAPVFDAKMEA